MNWIKQFYFPKPILGLLNTELVPSVDLWLVVHFISGTLLYVILGPGQQTYVLALLIAYEIFEQFLLMQNLIIKESKLNILLDIIAGYMGYMLAGGFI
jgi:hypothetical protein